MKRFISIVAVICVMVACVTSFAACSGNVDQIDKNIEVINSAETTRLVTVLSEGNADYSKVTEVLISDEKMQVLSVKTTFGKDGANDVVEKNDRYYDIVDNTHYREYYTFECKEHAKGDKPVIEWMYENKTSLTPFNLDALTALRAKLALFGLKSEDMVWSKEAKGFVFKEGKGSAASFATDVVVTAKSYSLEIAYKQAGLDKKISFMNFNTARVSFPILCKTYADQLNKELGK